jgi:hypothetical protein
LQIFLFLIFFFYYFFPPSVDQSFRRFFMVRHRSRHCLPPPRSGCRAARRAARPANSGSGFQPPRPTQRRPVVGHFRRGEQGRGGKATEQAGARRAGQGRGGHRAGRCAEQGRRAEQGNRGGRRGAGKAAAAGDSRRGHLRRRHSFCGPNRLKISNYPTPPPPSPTVTSPGHMPLASPLIHLPRQLRSLQCSGAWRSS